VNVCILGHGYETVKAFQRGTVTFIAPNSSPRRVARIITRLNIGGPAIQAITLSSGLNAYGFQTHLIHGRLDAGEGDIRTVLDGRHVQSLQIDLLRRPVDPLADARAAQAVYRELCRFQPHIVHTHTAKAGTVGRLAAMAYNRLHGRTRPVKVVHTYHGHVFEGYFRPWISSAFMTVERQLARATDVVIAISPRIRDEIVDTYRIARPTQVRVVPLGFELGRFTAIDRAGRLEARRGLSLPATVPVVTTVGRLTSIKRQDLFLGMAAIIAARHPDALFLVVGDGTLRPALERRAHDLGIAGRVRFLGWRADLPAIYGATDVFVMTSDNEGTPVALIEALAAGVAAASTDVGGVRDVMPETAGQFVVPRGNPEALADAVITLLSSEEHRNALGAAGRASVVARFGLDRLLRDISALYHDLA
jgi:glycosyltransferase involved in cell wall biosynthesis